MKKESSKKKKVNILDNIKNVFKTCCKAAKKFFLSLVNKFMELPRKIRMVIYVWCVVVLFLLVFILVSNLNKKFYDKYESFENSISSYALNYVKNNNLYTTKDNKLKIDLEILKQEGYIKNSEIIDDTCEGISVAYYDDAKSEFVVDSYLNCEKYTSKHYWDYK